MMICAGAENSSGELCTTDSYATCSSGSPVNSSHPRPRRTKRHSRTDSHPLQHPHLAHEFVVLKTDLAPDALPVDENGAVTEDVDGITLIGEAEDIEVGGTASLDVDLTPGKYVLICNILQTEPDGSLEAHYKVGMRTPFEVTAP